jgi:flagellar hook-basal body complex protein FliE
MSPIAAIPSSISSLMPAQAPGIQVPADLASPGSLTATQPAGDSFSSMLGKMVAEVDAQQNTASQSVAALQGGQNVPLHQAVVAMEEANVSFQLMVEVRNRMMDAYQEIMRMQV